MNDDRRRQTNPQKGNSNVKRTLKDKSLSQMFRCILKMHSTRDVTRFVVVLIGEE